MAVIFSGCRAGQKRINERITLAKEDKIPYGAWYAHEELAEIFPDAAILSNEKSLDKYRNEYNDVGTTEEFSSDTRKSYIIIAQQVIPDEAEVGALLDLVKEGRHVFISSFWISEKLLDTLSLKVVSNDNFWSPNDSLTVSVKDPVTKAQDLFTYPGKALDAHFTKFDSTKTTVLGYDSGKRPNYIKIADESGGAFYVHLAPLALSNFFLLHKNNKAYYDLTMSHLPGSTGAVYWDDYFRYFVEGKDNRREGGGFNALGWLQKQKGLSAGLSLLLLLLIIIYLVESKRKQRVIPVIKPIRNASVDFVKTIGQLYYQRKDNNNLAAKMAAHFLDHVRNRYNIKSTYLNDEFVSRVSWKSGYDEVTLKNLVDHLNNALLDPGVSDQTLVHLHHRLEDFYKHA